MMSLTEVLAVPMGVILLVMTVIEVSPIRCDPWGWLLTGLGRAINGEVLERVELLSVEVQELSAQIKRQQAESCQARIIRFGDELLHDTLHSKEHFDQILLDISVYERYCGIEPGFANGVASLTIARIKQVYENCLREHNFL